MVGDVTVPGSYLHSAFVVQSGSNEDAVWIADMMFGLPTATRRVISRATQDV